MPTVCVVLILFFRRWKMIEELSTYVISLVEIEKLHPNHSLEKDAIKPLKKSKSYEELKESIRLLSTTSSFILDGDDLEHERRKSFGFLDSKHHHSHTSEYDLDMFKKLSPYFNGKFSIYEMARREGILEENILRLVKKNPNVAVFYC